MPKNRRAVFWTKGALARHDETAWGIALEYGEHAAITYLEGIDHSIELIRENPRIGKPLTVHFLHRHQHTTSRGWEIIYDDDLQNSRVIIIDIQRGFNEDRHQRG
jgi:plasmid stabilization system protein ParE